MTKQVRNIIITLVSTLIILGGVLAGPGQIEPSLINVAKWDEWRAELFVAGFAQYQCDIFIYNAGNMVQIGDAYCPTKRWSIKIDGEDLDQIPCRVYAEQLESDTCYYMNDYMDVQYAPDDCGP